MSNETVNLGVKIDATVSPEAQELLAAGIPRWRSLLVWTLQLVGLAVGLLGTADVMNAVNLFRPDVAAWLSVSGVVLRLGIEPFVLLLGDLIDDGVRNNSFRLGLVILPFLAIGCLLLPGCAGLTFRASTPYGDFDSADGSTIYTPPSRPIILGGK